MNPIPEFDMRLLAPLALVAASEERDVAFCYAEYFVRPFECACCLI